MKLQQGFSLPETLVALALFAGSLAALMQYQLALAKGFQLQAEQKLAWRYAWQGFERYKPPRWKTALDQQPASSGCQLLTSSVVSPLGREAQLTLLRCPEAAE